MYRCPLSVLESTSKYKLTKPKKEKEYMNATVLVIMFMPPEI